MVLSTAQQVALAFTAVLFTFVVLPRMFGVGGGTGAKETRFDPRYSRKAAAPGPGAVRGQPINVNAPGSPQTPENMQQMKKLMEQELKSDKYKTNSNKGYVFTLMPLYAIGVGVFAAYKFLKIKSADDQAQKDKFAKGAKKSVEAENQLNELEQRLAQTERMLNSILTQLDPLTNCVKSVAQEQKNEIMSQLQTIRYLMKKRGMDCPPLNINEASCERNLDDLIESLGANDTSTVEASLVDKQTSPVTAEPSEKVYQKLVEDEAATEGEEMKELVPEESDGEAEEEEDDDKEEEEEVEEEAEEEGSEDCELMPSLEDPYETNIEEVGAEQLASGLRRRNRPD
ncbi:coiled-coil domain-containing protein 107 isoform X1 [Sebastes umbrosus]|uniref:coiled-coil domain-containing protein 107 isoform X1 n=1 Tax=Sebastes umbrosus TaxID=72105 RepID=UPI00189F667A|nr:coiled-coil domain-containing protein 107 isoform X1 [Sebastes umbrosus]XP_037617028.1 coiled-coil domain-containing protein 107 isoform X1 [Sebastes umbrosus]